MSKRQISSALLKPEKIKTLNVFLFSALSVINGLADFTLNWVKANMLDIFLAESILYFGIFEQNFAVLGYDRITWHYVKLSEDGQRVLFFKKLQLKHVF